MKNFYLIHVAILLLLACSKKNDSSPDILNYKTKEIHSKYLKTGIDFKGNVSEHTILANITLTNIYSLPVHIYNIELKTDEGLWATSPQDAERYEILPNKDTVLSFSFTPVNNAELFKTTGLRGKLLQHYTMVINFEVDGEKYQLNVENTADKEEYYSKVEVKKDTFYVFTIHNDSQFVNSQKDYEKSMSDLKKESDFVYVSENEIAVSGLNLKFHSYIAKDTLYAEIGAINHSKFDVLLDTNNLGITNSCDSKKILSVRKQVGLEVDDELLKLRTSDRMRVRYKHYCTKLMSNDLKLRLKDLFKTKNNQSLFFGDIKLCVKPVII
jgi:hypothetical protein